MPNMRIKFKDGRSDLVVPYTPQNHNQYSRIMGEVIKEITIDETSQVIPPPKKPSLPALMGDGDPSAMVQNMITDEQIDAIIEKRIAERLAKMNILQPTTTVTTVTPVTPVTSVTTVTDLVYEWQKSGLSKKAFCDKTGANYYQLLKLTKNLEK